MHITDHTTQYLAAIRHAISHRALYGNGSNEYRAAAEYVECLRQQVEKEAA